VASASAAGSGTGEPSPSSGGGKASARALLHQPIKEDGSSQLVVGRKGSPPPRIAQHQVRISAHGEVNGELCAPKGSSPPPQGWTPLMHQSSPTHRRVSLLAPLLTPARALLHQPLDPSFFAKNPSFFACQMFRAHLPHPSDAPGLPNLRPSFPPGLHFDTCSRRFAFCTARSP